MDSNGRRDTVEIVLENKGDSVFRCTYIPVLEGAHTVYVTFAGQQIPKSPFTVHISEGWFCFFQLFVIFNLQVSFHLAVKYEGQNFLQVVYSRSDCAVEGPTQVPWVPHVLQVLGLPRLPVVPGVQGLKSQLVRPWITLNNYLLGSKCGGGAPSPVFRCGKNLEPVPVFWFYPVSHAMVLLEI